MLQTVQEVAAIYMSIGLYPTLAMLSTVLHEYNK